MIRGPTTSFHNLVATAVLNKYGNGSSLQIDNLVSTTTDAIASDTECRLISRLRPVRDLADDVNNQTIVLTLIERYWSDPPKLAKPLTTLNTSSFGRTSSLFRVTDFVEDFGGEVPTSKDEVRARLDELERLCDQMVRGMAGSRLQDQALMLAHVFGSVIRVHPFEDGNGRTARLFAFYALKCWGRPLFPIPKVRNDSSWKVAMDSAVAGDALKLKDELFWRMEEAVKSVDSSERR